MTCIKLICIGVMTSDLLITGCGNRGQSVLVTGHRGASGLAPENTISAMLKAIEMGANFAELDVQESSDGVLVVLHDPTLKRTAGVDKNIWKRIMPRYKVWKSGSWFAPEFKGESISDPGISNRFCPRPDETEYRVKNKRA